MLVINGDVKVTAPRQPAVRWEDPAHSCVSRSMRAVPQVACWVTSTPCRQITGAAEHRGNALMCTVLELLLCSVWGWQTSYAVQT